VTRTLDSLRQPGPRHAADESPAPTGGSWQAADRRYAGGGPRHAANDLTGLTGFDLTGLNGHHRDAPSPVVTDHDREVALFAAEVRRAIAAKGCTLRQLETMLEAYGPDFRSSIGTLSSWQSGATTPPNTESGLNRVLAFERCVGVPAGDLAILVPGDIPAATTRPLTQIGGHHRPARGTLAERHKQLQRIVNRLSGPQRTIPVSTTKTYVLGWNYRPDHTLITPTLRAAHDTVDRYWFLHAPAADARPTVAAGPGCTRGRVLTEDQVLSGSTATADGEFQLVAVELLFDKVLARGEPYKFTFSIGYSGTNTPQDDLFRHIQVQPCESLDLRLEFQHQQPVQVHECRWTSQDFRLTDNQPLEITPSGEYHQFIPDPVPGAYGWTWTGATAGASTAA
jgi:hypothetical protein